MTPSIRGLKTFCRKTGWPIAEFADMPVDLACFVLGIHGVQLVITFPNQEDINVTQTLFPEGF